MYLKGIEYVTEKLKGQLDKEAIEMAERCYKAKPTQMNWLSTEKYGKEYNQLSREQKIERGNFLRTHPNQRESLFGF